MKDKTKLHIAIAEVLDTADPGDTFVCCIQHVGDCPLYLNHQCECKTIVISETTRVEDVVALYHRVMN